MIHSQWSNVYGKNILCVDSYENRVLQGRLYKHGQEMQEFSSLADFLINMESMLDEEQECCEGASSFKPADEGLPVIRKGKEMTFELQILFHQHNSWQGMLRWCEKNVENRFRSALELVLLIDGAMKSRMA